MVGIIKSSNFYDLNVHSQPDFADSPNRMVLEAKKLGYYGICFSSINSGNVIISPDISTSLTTNFHVYAGIEIQVDNVSKMKKNVARLREKADIIIISGGSEEINRAALEEGKIDILTHSTSRGSPLNHILAKAASDNGVALDFNPNAIIMQKGGTRIKILSALRKNVQLARKYDVPMIMTSNAKSHYDLRRPREMMALGMIMGMTQNEALQALSSIPQAVIKRNLDGNRIMDGVEVLE
ncbi:MAG: ribonuclease P protein component 3 [Nitrospirae bacterium]|nr:ribonuclease P protein component 3 [Nitrospirota bacterium]